MHHQHKKRFVQAAQLSLDEFQLGAFKELFLLAKSTD